MSVHLDPDAVDGAVAAAYPGSRFRCVELGPRHAVAARAVVDDDVRPGGYVSGPTQFAAADSALWYLVFAVLGRVELMAVTAELSIRYLRPAIGSIVTARADLGGVTRRRLAGSVRIWTDGNVDRPSAIAQGTYAIPDGPGLTVATTLTPSGPSDRGGEP